MSISVLALLADPYTVVARLSQLFLSVFLVQKTHFFHPLGSPSQSGWREFFNLLVSWEVNFNQRVGFEKSVIGPLRCSEVDFLFC